MRRNLPPSALQGLRRLDNLRGRGAPAAPASFRFEHTHQLTEREYLRLHGFPRRSSARGRIVRAFLAAAGVAALFSRYTAPAGVLLLLVLVIVLTSPWWLRRSLRGMYARTEYLQEPLTYGLSHQHVWVHGRTLRAEIPWEHVQVWQLRDGWLILSASGIPRLYFPAEKLRTAGVYDRVLALARRHAAEFGSPAADARSASMARAETRRGTGSDRAQPSTGDAG